MGILADFNLTALIDDYGCAYLVETGTGSGLGVEEASKHAFQQVFSIDSNHKAALDVALRFAANPMITIIHARIEKGLIDALSEIPRDDGVIFWLDAHAPGPEFRSEHSAALILPLERQLRLLAERRDLSRDIILIDDLRLYEDGAYEDGAAALSCLPAPAYRHVRFVEALLGDTHRIERSLRRTGTLSAFPLANRSP
jgi:hypothetical protein